MQSPLQIANKYELKELELNALLEITQAINNNLSEEALYKIYHFTLRGNLRLSKLALFVSDEGWKCKIDYGTDRTYGEVDFPKELTDNRKILETQELSSSAFQEFDVAIPVHHQNDLLAYVFLGGVQADNEESSINEHLNFIQALSNIIMVAIENKRLAREQLQQEVYQKELEIAKKVQQLLFPKVLPDQDEFKLAAHYSPHHSVGGDYYDWVDLGNNQKMVCIADVSGKGVPAAILMSNFQASLRTLLRKTTDLEEVIKELNHQVFLSANGENFITFFIALIDLNNGKLQYVNAGHNPPFMVTGNELKELDSGTIMLGAFEKIPFLEIGSETFEGRSMLFLYTDGLTEAFNEQEQEFGPERVEALVKEQAKTSPEAMLAVVLEKLHEFIGNRPYSDDITLLIGEFSA